jgi:hypothetical protein
LSLKLEADFYGLAARAADRRFHGGSYAKNFHFIYNIQFHGNAKSLSQCMVFLPKSKSFASHTRRWDAWKNHPRKTYKFFVFLLEIANRFDNVITFSNCS